MDCVEIDKMTVMDRRNFIQSLGLIATAAAVNAESLFGSEAGPRLAITMDDANSYSSPLMKPAERDEQLRRALETAGLKAALFVCGERVDSPAGKSLLKRWDADGHLICNHSYSHWYLLSKKITVEDYIADIANCEKLISQYGNFTKLFRFPYLKEGDTKGKRDSIRAYLHMHGYRNGYVTIDASDWYYNQRLEAALTKNLKADLAPFREVYLAHILDRAKYYRSLSLDVLGREIPHTVLIHHNLLNALFLGDLIAMFKAEGWEVIDASTAYADPIFTSSPNIIPAGESLVWALAKESGRFEDRLRYPAEDSVYEEAILDRLGL